MVFDEITLHNFGLYHGHQTIRLTPEPGRPVVLFGGLNGGGKTTLLDALQLVLYGKFARCSGRGALPYEEFLRQSISRSVSQEDGAALELELRRTSGGVSHRYRIHRYWSVAGNAIRESVEVYVDGAFDAVLTGAWAEQVDEFLPVELSQLFFFDGEKIETLANLENSSKVLRTAIQSLLGIDVVGRLATDLLVLERRKLGEKRTVEQKSSLDSETAELETLERDIARVSQSLASLKNELERSQYLAAQLESKYEQQGGLALEKKAQIEHERKDVAARVASIEDELREIASGSIPLLMLESLFIALIHQDDLEQKQISDSLLSNVLKEHDRHLLRQLTAAGLSKSVIDKVGQVLRGNAKKHTQKTDPPILMLERSVRNQAESLRDTILPSIRERSKILVEKEEYYQKQLVDVDRLLARIPSPETIESLVVERSRLASVVADALATQREIARNKNS